MSLQVYLSFNGNCREAVEFYREVFNADKPVLLTFGEAPQSDFGINVPDNAKDLVLHTELTIGEATVMFSDVIPGMEFREGNNFSLSITTKSIDDIKIWFAKLQEGGTVKMSLQETFFSKCYGSLTDKFGVNWQLSHMEES